MSNLKQCLKRRGILIRTTSRNNQTQARTYPASFPEDFAARCSRLAGYDTTWAGTVTPHSITLTDDQWRIIIQGDRPNG